MSENKKCPKCGFDNPSGLKFCGNCGSKVDTPEQKKYEGLGLLHFAGSAYLLISTITNILVMASPLMIAFYVASGIAGLLAGYQFFTGRVEKYTKFVSIFAICAGLVATAILFIMGLLLNGIIGPAWVIFAITIFAFWMAFKPAKK